jgi:hypothetical protein
LFTVVFALFWNVFVFFWTAMAIGVGAPLFFVLFSIPFWLVGLGMLGGVAFGLLGRTLVEINRETFRIQWRLLGLRYQVQGRTPDIDRVELGTAYRQNTQPVTACTIIEGVRTHRFGTGLAQREKEWLVEQLNGFLAKPRGLEQRETDANPLRSGRPFQES